MTPQSVTFDQVFPLGRQVFLGLSEHTHEPWHSRKRSADAADAADAHQPFSCRDAPNGGSLSETNGEKTLNLESKGYQTGGYVGSEDKTHDSKAATGETICRGSDSTSLFRSSSDGVDDQTTHCDPTVVDTPTSMNCPSPTQKIEMSVDMSSLPPAQDDPMFSSLEVSSQVNVASGVVTGGDYQIPKEDIGDNFTVTPTWPWTQLPNEDPTTSGPHDLPPYELPARLFPGQDDLSVSPAKLVSLYRNHSLCELGSLTE